VSARPSTHFPSVRRATDALTGAWVRLGRQTQFYGQTIRGISDAFVHYKIELIRLIAQMSLGTGALAVIGGTVVIVGFLTLSAGSLIAVQAYSQLQQVGVDALAGFTSAFLNVRLVAPLVAGIGLAATIGAGTTAQLGAMRIAEEIDALEVMGVRSVAYLASSRVVAGVVVVIPLYCVAVRPPSTASRPASTTTTSTPS
jgi:phospholipid/cholesterol/gamma-HCH transport system permease protein